MNVESRDKNYQTILTLCRKGGSLSGLAGCMNPEALANHLTVALWKGVYFKKMNREAADSFRYDICLSNKKSAVILDDLVMSDMTTADVLRTIMAAGIVDDDGSPIALEDGAIREEAHPFELLAERMLSQESAIGRILRDAPADVRNSIFSDVFSVVQDNTYAGRIETEQPVSKDDILAWIQDAAEGESLINWGNDNSRFDDAWMSHSDIIDRIIRKIEKNVDRLAAQSGTKIDVDDYSALRNDCLEIFPENITYLEDAFPLHLNLILDTDIHEDSDNFRKWVAGDDDPDEDELTSNGIVWLIHQQGYSVKDYLEGKKSPFLNSLHQEMEELRDYPGAVTLSCCVRSLDDLNRLELTNPDGLNFLLGPKTMCGLVDRFNGAGGTMEIELEKRIVVPRSRIREIQVEGAENNLHYTVDQIYGVVGSEWNKSSLDVTEKQPVPINIEDDMEAFREQQRSPVPA